MHLSPTGTSTAPASGWAQLRTLTSESSSLECPTGARRSQRRDRGSHGSGSQGLLLRAAALLATLALPVGLTAVRTTPTIATVGRAGGQKERPGTASSSSNTAAGCEPPALLDPRAVFNLGCRRFKRMCVDQQQFITYDPQYDPARSTEKVPYFDVRDIVYNWPNPWGNGDKFNRGRDLHVAPVSIRVGSRTQESSSDLRAPAFSRCTVPLVLWQRWMFNVGEMFEASYVRLYEELALGRVDPRMSLVVATPYGMRLPNFMQLIFGAIFRPQVISLAELSQRSPNGARLPSNATWEGYAVRCFENMYLCKVKNRKDDGHCAAGEHLLRHYEGWLPSVSDLFDPEWDADALKVVLAARPNATGRAILNEPQLLEACGRLGIEGSSRGAGRQGLGGSLGTTPSMRRRRVKCVSHVFGRDLMYDLALAKVTDVLVTTHGAVGYHSFYMPAGSSLIEVMPYKFPAAWANLYYARMLEYEKKVFYWSIWITDASNSRGSSFENATVFRPEFGPRESHVILPWAALRRHLQTILQVAGRRLSYKRVYLAGQHSISDTLELVPNFPDTEGRGWVSYRGPT